jgi:hypothetical protein
VTPNRPDPLQESLDRLDAPVQFFVRDDDAGWADARLLALLDVMQAAGVPIDLAAIPSAVTPALVRQLEARGAAGQGIGIHQHGYSHGNHEATGRKCEFGATRDAAQRHADLWCGRERLCALFGGAVDAIFTPPWNRVSVDTPAMLASLGYAALSRDLTAPLQQALPEISVHTDWSKQWRLAAAEQRDPALGIANDLARHVDNGARIGLMLHHAVMSDAELEALQALLSRWVRHPNARWVRMRELLPAAPASAAARPRAANSLCIAR